MSIATQRRLLVALLLVAACLGYYALRVRPARSRSQSMLVAAESARVRLEGFEASAATRVEAPGAQERDRQRSALDRRSQACAELFGSFASCGAPERLDALRLSVSQLADRCGLVVRSNIGCTQAERRGLATPGGCADSAPHAGYIAALLDPAASPSLALRRITFDSDFGGLRRFLASLSELPDRVVIVDFDVQALRDRELPVLRTELVIAY